MYRTGVLNTLSIQQIEQIVKKNLCWQEEIVHMSAKKKVLHNAAFCFCASDACGGER